MLFACADRLVRKISKYYSPLSSKIYRIAHLELNLRPYFGILTEVNLFFWFFVAYTKTIMHLSIGKGVDAYLQIFLM